MSLSKNFPVVSPTLLLDFANTRALDPRITFTRASPAVYYDGITTAVAEQNLILYSQEFQQTVWDAVTLGTTVTPNTTVAPNGTTTADTLAFVATAYRYNSYTAGTLTGRTFTFSCWVWTTTAKPVIGVRISNSSGTEATALQVSLTGTATRVSVTRTFGGADTVIICGFDNRSAQGGNNIAGSIVVWGAQLEERSTATAYNLTTTATITNYVPVLLTAAAGVARFDANPVTGSSLGLLIEGARTNLLLNSATQVNILNATVVTNVVSPAGTVSGNSINATASGSISYAGNGFASFTAGTTYTFSIYVKKASFRYVVVSSNSASIFNGAAVFDFDTGTLISGTGTITAVGNGWYRCSVSGSGTVSGPQSLYALARSDPSTNAVATFAGQTMLYSWGAQLEAGAFATTYIATAGTTQTREADVAVMTGTNFSSWYNAGEGTIQLAYTTAVTIPPSFPFLVNICDASYFDNRICLSTNTFTNCRWGILVAGVTQADNSAGNFVTANNTATWNMAYRLNDLAASANGNPAVTDTASLIPVCSQMFIGGSDQSGWFEKIVYYDVRLTNAQLATLTAN
jgi:uncharacterized RDD family membrane protein YckC